MSRHEKIKSEMTKEENRLWSSYAKENLSCMNLRNWEGCAFWSKKIKALFKQVESRLSEGNVINE